MPHNLLQKAKLGEPEDLPEVVNDLDWEEEVLRVQDHPQWVLFPPRSFRASPCAHHHRLAYSSVNAQQSRQDCAARVVV